MNRARQILAGSLAFAISLAILISMALAVPPAIGETQESGQLQQVGGGSEKSWWFKDPLEGIWNARVVITNCDSGDPTGLAFDAMGIFGGDGSFHDTNSNNPTLMVRSDAFGYWKHVRGNKYRFAFKVFNFDVAGMYLGYQVVRHDLVLARNGKSYKSKGTSEFFNPDGTERPPVRVCSETTATRFK
ncbi:MAG TPA: hypothetical protein VFZ51_08785 [Woeseiaceae bacterium]